MLHKYIRQLLSLCFSSLWRVRALFEERRGGRVYSSHEQPQPRRRLLYFTTHTTPSLFSSRQVVYGNLFNELQEEYVIMTKTWVNETCSVYAIFPFSRVCSPSVMKLLFSVVVQFEILDWFDTPRSSWRISFSEKGPGASRNGILAARRTQGSQ